MGLARWANVPDRWPTRLALVATYIPEGSSVLDLGAGAEGLRAHLPRGCAYTPADLPGFDMNRGRWPGGRYDVAVMAGVLEYATDPAVALRRMRELAQMAIVTYAHDWRKRDRDWNNLSRDRFRSLARAAGWDAREVATWRPERVLPQSVWVLS